MRRKDDEKEIRIKDAVIEVILEEGFSGASIAKIARRAQVSPATVYVYYDNKENMMRSIFGEYSDRLWDTVLSGMDLDHGGQSVVEQLIRNYYNFMMDNETIFSFVEEFSNCPALFKECGHSEEVGRVINLFHSMKEQHIFKPYSDATLFAVLFRPVQSLRDRSLCCGDVPEDLLRELIGMVQDMVLC